MTFRELVLVIGSALFSAAYMTPSLVGVLRLGTRAGRVLLISALLGWTLVGWVWAMKLAIVEKQLEPVPQTWQPWLPARPEAPRATAAPPGLYVDGEYLISECGEARTWAVCAAGRWGVAYELAGTQRTSAWVDVSDIPIEILALALPRTPGRRPR